MVVEHRQNQPQRRTCVRCVMDDRVPRIRYDANGVCNYCHIHDGMDAIYPVGEDGKRILDKIAEKIRASGKKQDYDCVVGVSGGRDTSYCLYYAKEIMGLSPLAVHFDNGWDSDVAKNNLARLCSTLDVDLQTIIMDWPESRALTNANIRACVPYIDVTDDVGIANALYRSAAKENVRYILLSHSFREEGVAPLLWNYMDARYTRAIVKRYCDIKEFKQFQNVDIHHMLYWIFAKGIRVVNITNYYDDTGDKIETFLQENMGWEDTGQHHMDNEMFAIVYDYARRKFGFDWRITELSAKVRSGVITRDQALEALETLPFFETPEMLEYCLKKQGLSREEYESIIAAPNKYFTDYPSYYPLLRALRLPIKALCRMHAVPIHTYEKYFECI